MSLPRILRRRPAGSSPARGRTHGFTMIEVLTVAVVVGTLVRVAMPGVHDLVVRARAAEVVGDFEVVRLAVLGYYGEHHEWPADGYTGQAPLELVPYLPEGFSFERAGYSLDWESWVLPSGLPSHPQVRGLVGISVVTEDRALGHAVLELLGSRAGYALGNAYTFILERM